MKRKIIDPKGFIKLFDTKTGFYIRSGLIENGKDTGVDPFMASFPELIDVGVMGFCTHGQSGLCAKSGIQCYQSGLTQYEPNMTLENFKKIIDEGREKGLLQVALGGRGDVDQHEHFEEILKYSAEKDIVPNFTTSGLGMTKEKAEICKKYCGAVAVSMYSRLKNNTPMIAIRKRTKDEKKNPYNSIHDIPVKFTFGNEFGNCVLNSFNYTIDNKVFSRNELTDISEDYMNGEYEIYRVYEEKMFPNYTFKAIKMLLKENVKTNIHYVVGNNTIDEAITRLKYNGFPAGINAVIFLLHKPVGLGKEDNVLKMSDKRVKEFFKLIDKNNFPFKIGFDSCTVPGLINMTESIDYHSLDSCEGGRYSMYITSDMKALPCSFDNQEMKWAFDLNNHTIEEAWNSVIFDDFRNHFKTSCNGCIHQAMCRGGCPIRRQIVLCDSKNKNLK